MNFYLTLYRPKANTGWPGNTKPELYLPKVRFPECRHERDIDVALPLELPEDSPIREHVTASKYQNIVSQEQWEEIAADLAQLGRDQGHPDLWIAPGMRIGPLHLKIAYRGASPPIVDAPPYELYSETLVRLFQDNYLTGFDLFPAYVEARNKTAGPVQRYYELTFPKQVPLAKEANWHQEVCPICGTPLKSTYDALLIDEQQWDGSDFVRTPALRRELVSERVKDVMERSGLKDMIFVPSERLARGPGAKDLTEVLADLTFEQRQRERAAFLSSS